MYLDKNGESIKVGDWVDTNIERCFGKIEDLMEDYRGLPTRENYAMIRIYAQLPFLHNFPTRYLIRITEHEAMLRILEL